MTSKNLKFAFLIFAAVLAFFPSANAQRRDFLTETEVELVRDAQAIDQRTEVFVKAVDRRFAVIGGNQIAPAEDKKSKKEAETWGAPPSGTRLELLTDIKKILAEAIDNIDDVAARQPKPDDKLFPKAVRRLAEAANRFLPELKSDLNKTADEREKGVILSSIEFCEQIIEASAKVPKDESKDKKKGS